MSHKHASEEYWSFYNNHIILDVHFEEKGNFDIKSLLLALYIDRSVAELYSVK
jgi:hypothetical protein